MNSAIVGFVIVAPLVWFQVSVLKLNLLVCEALAGFPPVEGWPLVDAPREDWHKVIVSFLLRNLTLCAGAELSKRVTPVLHHVFFHFPATGEHTHGRFLWRAVLHAVCALLSSSVVQSAGE